MLSPSLSLSLSFMTLASVSGAMAIAPKVVKEKQRCSQSQYHQERKIVMDFACNRVELFLITFLIICFICTALQFVPYKSFLSPSDLRSFLTKLSATPHLKISESPPLLMKSAKQEEEEKENLVIKRAFDSVGSAAYLFVQMGAYRGGPNSFALVGLASKPIHVYSNPDYRCHWVPAANRTAPVAAANAFWILPDWGYGRVYTAVVVNCTFDADVGADGSGGELVVTATSGGGDGVATPNEERFVAMEETPGAVNMSAFTSPPKYDYLYCGSPLYGALSPQRVREWVAYHAMLFGPRSHFVVYDAGGVHPEVLRVLQPWIDKGIVTLQDIRDQERFDGYYHNQFLVLNDCLHRYRYDAKWMFFFDVDEFIFVDKKMELDRFMESMAEFTQFTIEQMPMSSKLCDSKAAGITERIWGIEKLVYKDTRRMRRDRKYAIQPRNALSVGVHLSQNFTGKYTHKTDGRIKYFHYHGTIGNREETCKEFKNETELLYERVPYHRDETLRRVAGLIKRFELKTIGKRLVRTRQ